MSRVIERPTTAVGGLPFELKVSPPPIPNMATMTQAEFDSELQKGYDSAMADNLIDARRAHAELMDRMAIWNTPRS